MTNGTESFAQKRNHIEDLFVIELANILENTGIQDFKTSPTLPTILVQPDILVSPAPGRLFAIVVDYLDRSKNAWDFVLERIEQAFELKTAVSNDLIIASILLTHEDEVEEKLDDRNLSHHHDFLQSSDAIQLLRRFFDFSAAINYRDTDGFGALADFTSQLFDSNPRAELFHLWETEREINRNNLNRYSENNETSIARRVQLDANLQIETSSMKEYRTYVSKAF